MSFSTMFGLVGIAMAAAAAALSILFWLNHSKNVIIYTQFNNLIKQFTQLNTKSKNLKQSRRSDNLKSSRSLRTSQRSSDTLTNIVPEQQDEYGPERERMQSFDESEEDVDQAVDLDKEVDVADLFPYETLRAFFKSAKENVSIYSKLQKETMKLKQRELSMVSRLSIDELNSAKISKISHNLVNFERNNHVNLERQQARLPQNDKETDEQEEAEEQSNSSDSDLREESST
jgi:membrane-bound lytic murein transglycosylase